MTQVVTLKLTVPELEILDWLVNKLESESRSQALRRAFLDHAKAAGLRTAELQRARLERSAHRPRRAVKFTRLIGPRKRGAPDVEAAS